MSSHAEEATITSIHTTSITSSHSTEITSSHTTTAETTSSHAMETTNSYIIETTSSHAAEITSHHTTEILSSHAAETGTELVTSSTTTAAATTTSGVANQCDPAIAAAATTWPAGQYAGFYMLAEPFPWKIEDDCRCSLDVGWVYNPKTDSSNSILTFTVGNPPLNDGIIHDRSFYFYNTRVCPGSTYAFLFTYTVDDDTGTYLTTRVQSLEADYTATSYINFSEIYFTGPQDCYGATTITTMATTSSSDTASELDTTPESATTTHYTTTLGLDTTTTTTSTSTTTTTQAATTTTAAQPSMDPPPAPVLDCDSAADPTPRPANGWEFNNMNGVGPWTVDGLCACSLRRQVIMESNGISIGVAQLVLGDPPKSYNDQVKVPLYAFNVKVCPQTQYLFDYNALVLDPVNGGVTGFRAFWGIPCDDETFTEITGAGGPKSDWSDRMSQGLYYAFSGSFTPGSAWGQKITIKIEIDHNDKFTDTVRMKYIRLFRNNAESC